MFSQLPTPANGCQLWHTLDGSGRLCNALHLGLYLVLQTLRSRTRKKFSTILRSTWRTHTYIYTYTRTHTSTPTQNSNTHTNIGNYTHTYGHKQTQHEHTHTPTQKHTNTHTQTLRYINAHTTNNHKHVQSHKD